MELDLRHMLFEKNCTNYGFEIEQATICADETFTTVPTLIPAP